MRAVVRQRALQASILHKLLAPLGCSRGREPTAEPVVDPVRSRVVGPPIRPRYHSEPSRLLTPCRHHIGESVRPQLVSPVRHALWRQVYRRQESAVPWERELMTSEWRWGAREVVAECRLLPFISYGVAG